jgi:formylmethanofuran dehydrogenase subunit E
MAFPAFFDAAPRLTLRDPLAAFLGAAEDGVIDYRYADAVKLAGHSCPTVASAYLMTCAALGALYRGEMPERGGIRVDLREGRVEGATGVVANVASFLTGATHDTGFKGIGGKFDRRDLLFFGVGIAGQLRYTRVDTGAAATVSARLDRVPADPRMALLLQRCLAATATADEVALFQSLWQGRVRKLLIEHADDPEIIVVQH